MNKSNKENVLYQKITLVFLLALMFFYFIYKHENKKNTYIITESSQIYWYANKEVENVSYYMLLKNDTVSCDYTDEKEDFMFCSWKFSYFRDPLYGWIKSENLKEK